MFNWTSVGVALLNLLVGGALVAFIRSRAPIRKIEADREANLLTERANEMESMRKRIAALEAQAEQRESAHEDERIQWAEERAYRDAKHEAEKALGRHQIANLDASFQALLLLLKKGVPVADAVEAVEKMRADQLARETVEKAAIKTADFKKARP
jgi:hypothetical protein